MPTAGCTGEKQIGVQKQRAAHDHPAFRRPDYQITGRSGDCCFAIVSSEVGSRTDQNSSWIKGSPQVSFSSDY